MFLPSFMKLGQIIGFEVLTGNRLCGLVATDPEVTGSIPGATRLSEK
jgi:hypothetical protein